MNKSGNDINQTMNKKEKKNFSYTGLGVAYGASLGLLFGLLLFEDNFGAGIGIGVALGVAIGAILDGNSRKDA